MSSTEFAEWEAACQAEYKNLMSYNTWTLVERPTHTNIVGNRWVFCVKRDNLGQIYKCKARLIAQGFSQIPRIDFIETYSPTIRFTSIRFILALAAHHGLVIRQIDIKGAYLNGELEEEVYMRQPEGFIQKGDENLVCKLIKGIYGLKQSGRVWHQTLKSKLGEISFTAGEADHTVFF
jgi:Reverse transcriptase (RNA-dependent DNA polymerase)